VFGRTQPDFEGYGAIDPIIEVRVDVGMIEDERLEDWERELQDPRRGGDVRRHPRDGEARDTGVVPRRVR
jgi:hypothetical protein